MTILLLQLPMIVPQKSLPRLQRSKATIQETLGADKAEQDYHGTILTLISIAYNTLRDCAQASMTSQGFAENSKESLAALHTQQRDQAEKDIELMEMTYDSLLRSEEECRGVVIVSAIYMRCEVTSIQGGLF